MSGQPFDCPGYELDGNARIRGLVLPAFWGHHYLPATVPNQTIIYCCISFEGLLLQA